MTGYLRLKLALMLVGGPLALAAVALEEHWVFFAGLSMLVIALGLPARESETLEGKLRRLVRHLPGVRWFGRGDAER